LIVWIRGAGHLG